MLGGLAFKQDWQPMAQWSRSVQCLSIILTSCMVGLLGYMLFVSSPQRQQKMTLKKIVVLQNLLAQKQVELASPDLDQSVHQAIQAEYDVLKQQLALSRGAVARFLEQMTDCASQSGLVFPAVRLLSVKKGQMSCEQPIELTAVGYYPQWCDFLTRLNRQPYSWRIQEMRLSLKPIKDRPGQLAFTLHLLLYYHLDRECQ